MKCRSCGQAHASNMTCAQHFASNSPSGCASNSASNSTVRASNKVEVASNSASNKRTVGRDNPARISGVGEASGAATDKSAVESSPGDSRKQRWGREAYNTYQRDYMRKRRA